MREILEDPSEFLLDQNSEIHRLYNKYKDEGIISEWRNYSWYNGR